MDVIARSDISETAVEGEGNPAGFEKRVTLA